MHWHADWLNNAMVLPHVPTLGLVHPQARLDELFNALFDLPQGQFLPYDKDQRWFTTKDEIVLPDHVHHSVERTVIATLNRRGFGRVTVYHYAQAEPDLATLLEFTGKAVAECGVDDGRVVWFQRTVHPTATCSHALLADASGDGPAPDLLVVELGDCPPHVQAGFTAFTEESGSPGLTYLGRLWAEGAVSDPVLVSVIGDHVVGAIGPMQTYPSPTRARQLLPQYFAVLPNHRRAGHGRALWRAAQQWGRRHGAAYQLLQAVPGSPADGLYASEGVRPLGYVCALRT